MSQNLPVAVLNTSIVTADGTFVLETIGLDEARALVADPAGILSAVGHQSTAQILTELLEVEVPVNRITFAQQQGQVALVFKPHGRPPEGAILSRKEIEAIGYSFKRLTRTT